MSKALNDAQGRALALGLLLFALIAIVALLATPLVLVHIHYEQKLEGLNDRLARYERVAASRGELTRRLEQMRALDGRRFYLKNAGPALAAGEIQELEKSLIETNGGRLASMQIQQPKDEGAFRRVAVNVQVLGSIGAIQRILLALERSEPFLFVDNLNVRSLSADAARDAATPEAGLVVQFDLIGYAIRKQAIDERGSAQLPPRP
jgi:general secretion pathway protein M